MLMVGVSPGWKQRALGSQWNVLCVMCFLQPQLLIRGNNEKNGCYMCWSGCLVTDAKLCSG